MGAILEVTYDSGAVTAQTLNANATYWHAIGDSRLTNASGTEVDEYVTRRTAGTFSGLCVRVTANTVTATSTVRFRKNQANGNQAVSIGSSSTGEFQDTTNTDTVAAGDKANFQTSTGATGTSMTATVIGVVFAATSNTVKRLYHLASSYATTTTQQFAPLSGGGNAILGETDAQFKLKAAGTLINLWANVSSNSTSTAATTISSRKNTAAGAMSISVAAASTGLFEDLVNSDSIAADDLCDYGFVQAAGGTGNATIRAISCELSTTNSKTQFAMSNSNPFPFLVNANTTTYYGVGGFWNAASTEVASQTLAQVSGIVSKLEAKVIVNGVTASSTISVRKNGAAGNGTISVPTSSTGYFEDATSVDSILATDEINYRWVAGATGTNMGASVMGSLFSGSSLFLSSLLAGLGAGGPFFRNPLG